MAELVGGAFLSAALQVACEKLASSEMFDFFRRKNLNDSLLEKLHIILISVNQVIEDAEEMQYRNPNVKKWLDELKHVVFKAEDLLDDIDTEASQQKLHAEFHTVTSKVRGFLTPSVTSFDKEIEPRIQKVLDTLEYLIKQNEILGLKARFGVGTEVGVNRKLFKRLPTSSLLDESNIYGRDAEKENMISILLSHSGNQPLNVISITGLGGMGKTTLARLVYDDKRMKDEFQLRAWVTISEEFDVLLVTKAILQALNCSIKDSDDPQIKLEEELMEKKFIVDSKSVMGEFYVSPKVNCAQDIPIKARYFSYLNSRDFRNHFDALSSCHQLRSFLSFQHFMPNDIMEVLLSRLGHLKYMRALSLKRHRNIENLPNDIGNLKHLRYLDLSHTEIESLPDSTCLLINLQTLKLKGCRWMTKLPSNFHKLINLCHLDLEGSGIKEMPQYMRKLKYLRASTIIVKHNQGLKQLGTLKDVHLNELVLHWGLIAKHQEHIRNNAFQPNCDVKEVTVEGYGGTKFPDCVSLPPLGQLPFLEKLRIFGLDGLRVIGNEFYGSNSSSYAPFRSLSTLGIKDMKELEEWNICYEGDSFPCLQKLFIMNCPKLTLKCGSLSSSLRFLGIDGCPKLIHSRKDWGLHNLLSLEHILVCNHDFENEESFPEEGLLPPNLRSLELENCSKLKAMNYKGLLHLHSLQSLSFEDCPLLSFENFPDEGLPRSLSELRIMGKCPLLKQRCLVKPSGIRFLLSSWLKKKIRDEGIVINRNRRGNTLDGASSHSYAVDLLLRCPTSIRLVTLPSERHPRDTVHHSITLCTAREHCAPPDDTVPTACNPGTSITTYITTATLASSEGKRETGNKFPSTQGTYLSCCVIGLESVGLTYSRQPKELFGVARDDSRVKGVARSRGEIGGDVFVDELAVGTCPELLCASDCPCALLI
ncbi:putative disease resistance RPP13-like protein 1 [Senna tora]|uniref:Putative disease resistance RPP13-like protein 1 n=1 Tax=Senna tora TaxID=362788 RepID=A0A834TPC4_9FABA|nr:putative disease resistance RPP13-like protein 1 [Senna tora]